MGIMAAALEKYYQKILLSQRFSPVAMKKILEPLWQENGYRQELGTVREILVISLNAIGDNVLYSAFLRELRRNNPDSRITLVVTPLVYNLMELCPYVNTIHSLPYHCGENFSSYFPRFIRFVQEKMLNHRFDISVCVQWSDDKRPMNLLAYLSGAAQRYGISDKSILVIKGDFSLIDQWEFLLTHPIITPPEIMHEADRALFMVKAMGGNIEQKAAEIWLNNTDIENSRRLLNGRKKFVVLGLGAGQAGRKYPLAKWIVAMQQLWDVYGTQIVLLGGKGEADDGTYIEKVMPDGSVLSLAGCVSLRETAAIIKSAACYLGNDTGMMHMAAAMQTPLIAIFREAKIRAAAPPGIFSEIARFAPWKAKADAVVLQPERAAGECMHTVVYGGCKENKAHCIAQVTAAEIVAAYERLRGRL